MNRSKIVRVSIILFLGVFWFIAVDWSWFVHDCPDCWHGEDITQYRVFTVPIHTTVYEYPSVIQQVATDLGKPCMHPNMESWHKHRRWGLLFCKSPCFNGIYRLSGKSSWYDQAAATKIVASGKRAPSLKEEFHDRVFTQHDYQFLRVVLDQADVDHPIQD